jgi:hypothetical protein
MSRGEAQRRRNRARLNAELVFALYAPELEGRFGRKKFEDFVARYLGDDQAAEDVEEYSRQLQWTLLQHVDREGTPRGFASFEELARWYLHQQRRIEAAELDRELKQKQLLGLGRRYAEFAERLFEELPAGELLPLTELNRSPLLLQESCR